MRKPILSVLMLCLLAAGAAQAQPAGGRGHGGGRGKPPSGGGAPAGPRSTPANQVEIVGVITAIDPGAQRITIAYDAVEALNWPAGTTPFAVSRTDLLKDASVGEKVRFKLDSQQISDLRPF
jgi:Cu/Ag efflux protein CusF